MPLRTEQHSNSPKLVVLGCGYVGTAVAHRALRNKTNVIATTRDPQHARALSVHGIEAYTTAELTPDRLRSFVHGANVLVAFPPDGATDQTIAADLSSARTVAYVSTTGVYGKARGRVDEQTPTDPCTPRAAIRLAAEQCYRTVNATILRAAGIYGPGRGLHLRIARGEYRIPGDGSNVVSRIHVDDLAFIIHTIFERRVRGATFVVSDDTPVPQIEAITWLCQRLNVALPPSIPVSQASETLRHDRRVDNTAVKQALGVALQYPSYREGFMSCLVADGLVVNAL